VKKIRRTRIRTETSKLVFIQDQTGEPGEALDAHEFCPACGQRIAGPAKDMAVLPPVCAEFHEESNCEGVFDLKKQEK
jgi:hypothetical protein